MKKILYPLLMIVIVTGFSCKKEFQNPNAPTEDEVFNSADGMTRVIVGLKQRFAVNSLGVAPLYSSISANGLSTNELKVLNAGNADLAQLEIGGSNVAPNNGVVASMWSTTNIIANEAQKLIDNSSNVGDPNIQAGIKIYGHLFKALSLGTLATFWEQVPVVTGKNAAFSSRADALAKAVQLLDEASALYSSSTIPASFISQVGSEINIPNTLLALSARYNNMLGNNDAAIAKASAVDLSSKSVFYFNNTNPNPVFRSSLTNNNTYGIKADFGLTGSLAPDPADQRIPFYLVKNAVNGSGFFLDDASTVPVYLPGEMLLIQAEAYARKNDPVNAVKYIDLVRTKTPSSDAFGVGADLPAYSGAVDQNSLLDEIYKQRAIELYMSGMKLEDSRRFNRPGPGTAGAERTRNFYPYPSQERDGNPNTPADPVI